MLKVYIIIVLGFSRETHQEIPFSVSPLSLDLSKETHDKELVRVIVEAGKSRQLLSSSWGPSTAAGVVPV